MNSRADLQLIGVPYSSGPKRAGIAKAIGVLREAGLPASLNGRRPVRDDGDLDLLPGTGRRGRSGLLNEEALGRLVSETRAAAAQALECGRIPLLVGGDCPVLLGALAAGRDRHRTPGLLLVDGHEDAWPSALSETGEGSDSEVAIALGQVADLPGPLDELVPLVSPQAVAMLGPRDRRELQAKGVRSLADAVAVLRDDEAVRAGGARASVDEAIAALARSSDSFWLHIDLDVLCTDDFPAADYLQPGGLNWYELLEIAGRALADPACFGCSVVIYNPDLDPERTSAFRIVRFVSDLVSA